MNKENKELFKLIEKDMYSDYECISKIIEGTKDFAEEVVEYKNYASSLCVFCWEYRIEKVPEDFDTSKFYIINKENFNFCNDDIFNMSEQKELKASYGMYIPRDSHYYAEKEILKEKYGLEKEYNMYADDDFLDNIENINEDYVDYLTSSTASVVTTVPEW